MQARQRVICDEELLDAADDVPVLVIERCTPESDPLDRLCHGALHVIDFRRPCARRPGEAAAAVLGLRLDRAPASSWRQPVGDRRPPPYCVLPIILLRLADDHPSRWGPAASIR